MKLPIAASDTDAALFQIWQLSMRARDPDASFDLSLDDNAKERIAASAELIAQVVGQHRLFYGINTGFGHFAHTAIPEHKLSELQRNIILSHASGVGDELPREIVMAMWLFRLQTLSKGKSGIRLQTLEFVLKLLNSGVLACVPSRGSVGASGDLAPAAHCCLPLLGEGECTVPHKDGFRRVSSKDVLSSLGLEPVTLGPKEGLSLLNGTHLSLALATRAVYEIRRLLKWANLAVAMSMDSAMASPQGFCEAIAEAHVHRGTQTCARQIRSWLEGESEIFREAAASRWVQDPYCIRCAPQVHGMAWEQLEHGCAVLADELEAITDNPIIDPERELIASGGNFHAIYPAKVCDNLSAAVTTLASISERRINLLQNSVRTGLSDFLIDDGGVNSGFMMAHVTAAALLAECRTLCLPASVNSISTNCDQEDHVSMAPIAGFHAGEIIDRYRLVLAIELLCHCQALDLRSPLSPHTNIKVARELIREKVPMLHEDRPMSGDIEKVAALICSEDPPL